MPLTAPPGNLMAADEDGAHHGNGRNCGGGSLMTSRAKKPSFTVRDRRILTLMVLVGFVAAYGGSQITSTLPFARKSLGISEGGMFWVFGITRAASLAGLAFAVVADRAGRRKPFLVAFTMIPAGNLLTVMIPGVAGFVATQAVTRVAVIGVAALSVVYLAEEITPGRRALGLGIYALAGSMGSGLGLVLLPVAEQSPDAWRILFGLTAVGFLLLPLLNRYLAESRAFVPFGRDVTFRQVLNSGLAKHFWPLAGMAFFIAVFSSPALNFVMERLVNDLAWEAAPARFLLIVFSGLGALGLILGGRMADAIGRRHTTVLALALGLLGGVGFYTLDSGWLLAPAIFLATAGLSMLTPAFAAHRSELFPTRVRAMAAGWITNVAIAGSITGFVIGALVVDRAGLSTTITILGSGLLISMYLVLRLPETRGMDLVRAGAARRHTAGRVPRAAVPPSQPASGTARPDAIP